jgi:hypothetical protein
MRVAALLLAIGCSKAEPRARPEPAPQPTPAPVPVVVDASVVVDATVALKPIKLVTGSELPDRCWAWSPVLDAWACSRADYGRDGHETFRNWEIVFPGSSLGPLGLVASTDLDQPMKLGAADAFALDAVMKKHGFVEIPPTDTRTLKPNSSEVFTNLEVRWRHAKSRGGDGEFGMFDDRIEIRCSGSWVQILKREDGRLTPKLLLSPTGNHVLLEWRASAGREGGHTTWSDAQAIDLITCRPMGSSRAD